MLTLDDNHIYRYNDVIVPGVSEILQAAGFTNFSKVPDYVLEPAQKFGTAVHKACELWDRGELNEGKPSDPIVYCSACKQEHAKRTLCPPLKPYLESWRKFKKDFNIDTAYIEYKVYSKKWGFAGMLDRIVHPGEVKTLILVDLKSSTTILPATELQTAAYQIAFEEQTGLKISERWSVQLCDNGIPKTKPYKNRTNKVIFLGAVNGYYFKKENNLL